MDRNRICIIGLGLMGGSLALGLKNKGFKGDIIGYDTNIEYMEEAKISGAIDVMPKNLEDGIKDADIIIIAVSLLNYSQILEKINKHARRNVIVTDLGSVKAYPMKIANDILDDKMYFIGGHPMSGSEKSGLRSCSPFLYENAYYFLTPDSETPDCIVRKLKSMIEFLGAYPVVITANEHDRIVSRISHLPHLIAMTLVNLMGEEENLEYLTFIGGGFRDTTRVASGNTNMWKDICATNKDEIVNSIDSFQSVLEEFKLALINKEEKIIEQSLEMGKSIRDEIPNRNKGYIIPLFEVIMSIEDKPGVLGEITQMLGANKINIKRIEILNARQGEPGALKMGFDTQADRHQAVELLKSKNMGEIYLREEI